MYGAKRDQPLNDWDKMRNLQISRIRSWRKAVFCITVCISESFDEVETYVMFILFVPY